MQPNKLMVTIFFVKQVWGTYKCDYNLFHCQVLKSLNKKTSFYVILIRSKLYEICYVHFFNYLVIEVLKRLEISSIVFLSVK